MPQRPPAPFPPKSQIWRRIGVFSVGIAIGCVLVGILLLSRQMLVKPGAQPVPNRAGQNSSDKALQPESDAVTTPANPANGTTGAGKNGP